MYRVEDLFDKRSIIGTKVEKILEEKNCTKAELCKKTGVSRPTIDKLIAGTLTSKTNYEKHMSKILNYLEITPDRLLGNVTYNGTRKIRNLRKITSKEMAKATGIPLKRLKQIEAGERATVAELRDIAICLSISVRVLIGENFFEPQIAAPEDFIRFNKDEETKELSGFWGHVGILLSNTDKYLWFPITSNTRKRIFQTMKDERIVIPCMNNKVLFLYMPNVKEIVLLDEACDQPGYANWDSDISCGEIPLVVFEALEDYVWFNGEKYDNDIFSRRLVDYLDKFVESYRLTEDDTFYMLNQSIIYYSDGKKRMAMIDFDDDESVSTEISGIYNFGDSQFSENVLFFTDIDGSEIFINMKNVSMLELPLLKVEEAICNEWDKI